MQGDSFFCGYWEKRAACQVFRVWPGWKWRQPALWWVWRSVSWNYWFIGTFQSIYSLLSYSLFFSSAFDRKPIAHSFLRVLLCLLSCKSLRCWRAVACLGWTGSPSHTALPEIYALPWSDRLVFWWPANNPAIPIYRDRQGTWRSSRTSAPQPFFSAQNKLSVLQIDSTVFSTHLWSIATHFWWVAACPC